MLKSAFFVLSSLLFALPLLTSAQTPPVPTEPNLKVAFYGDQGISANSVAVLNLVKAEAPSLVIHLGDFDYTDNPIAWDDQMNSVLGANFPVLSLIGNHDLPKWSGVGGYQEKIIARSKNIAGLSCAGDLGTQSSCIFKGLHLILSGVGTIGSGHGAFIHESFAKSNSIWKLCGWHKDQRNLQLGTKSDEVGWEAYEECRIAGAIIATAHEHSYERTKTLVSMENQTVDSTCATPETECVGAVNGIGRTFAFVSGIGGSSIRRQLRCLPTTYPYGCQQEWAKIYTSDQSANFGALFITFNVDGDQYKAQGYFKNIAGQIVDTFTILKDHQALVGAPSNLKVK